jgi:site-specific recombinase XerD
VHGHHLRRGTSQFTTYITGLDDAPGAVADIDRSHVEGYLVDLAQRGRSPATLNNRYRALRRFFDYLLEEDELADHPMVRMTPPQVPDQPVEVLSEDDLRALLGTCTTKSFEDVRDQAIIRLLADTGMRRGELLGIDVDDLDLDGAVAFVTGKGQRGRACPFGRKTSLAVDRYLRVRRRLPHAAEEQPLWLTRHGRLNVSGVATMLRRRGERSGIGPVHPHQLRHTFAYQWLSQGGNERDLMRSRLRPYTAATRPAWAQKPPGDPVRPPASPDPSGDVGQGHDHPPPGPGGVAPGSAPL